MYASAGPKDLGTRSKQGKTTMKWAKLLGLLFTILCVSMPAFAEDGWKMTGAGVRQKTVLLVDVDVYAITHEMKGDALPPKNKQAVIEADIDKRFNLSWKRDIDQGKITDAFKKGFADNGYTDSGKINQFIGAVSADVKKNHALSIVYSPANKTTTISVQDGKSVSIAGVDFMKATWSLWFGKIDQPKLGDQLIARL
jgi:hypothetical protein